MAGKRYQEGTVAITGKNKDTWTGYFYVYDQDGQRHRRSANLGPAKGVNRKQAMQKLRPVVDRETRQPMRTSGEDTVSFYWLNRFAPNQDWSVNSRCLIEGIFRRQVLPLIGSAKLQEVTGPQVQALLKGCVHFSQGLINKIRIYLNLMFEELEELDLIPKNPITKKVRVKSQQKPTERYLTMEEVDRLFAQLSPRDRLICRIAVVMGLRPGELFALTWKDYDLMRTELLVDKAWVNGAIQKPKTESSVATISVPSSIVQGLKEWREASASDSPYIFPSSKGTPYSCIYYLKRIIKPAAIRAGIMQPRPKNFPKKAIYSDKSTAVNFQAMRRTCATWSQGTASIKDVQAIMRHANASTTLKYYMKAIPASVRAAQEALDARVSLGTMASMSEASQLTM